MSNQGKVGSPGPLARCLQCLTCVAGHLRIKTEYSHIQGVRRRHSRPEVHISLPRPWVRSSLQSLSCPNGDVLTRAHHWALLIFCAGLAKNIQVWRAAIRARLPGSSSRNQVRQCIWQGHGKGNHARDSWKVFMLLELLGVALT